MKIEQIDVPYFEGYRCVGYGVPTKEQYYLRESELVLNAWNFNYEWLVYEKIPPKRYIFEEMGERRANPGEYYFDIHGNIIRHDRPKHTMGTYTVLRRIDE